jgi:thiol-disulfide isomerase/thioredoxin
MRTFTLAVGAAGALIGAQIAAFATHQGERTSAPAAEVGVDFTFRRPVFNGFGIERLSDLRGKPVLIEYWSHHCPPCVSSAVPDAIQLQAEFGDAVQVLLCEAGHSSDNQVLSYALNKGWLATSAMWTTEHPVTRETKDVPYFMLLDAQGEIAMEGIASEQRRELEQKLEELVKDAAKGPRELSRDLAKAITEANDGNFTKARDIAGAAVEEAGEDTVKLQEAKRVLSTVEERLEQRLKRARWMLDNGYPIEATDSLSRLAKGVKGWPEPEVRVADMNAELETPEMKLEVEAQKALQKIEKKLFVEPDVRLVKQLQKIVEKYPRTKTAERAKQLAKIASI